MARSNSRPVSPITSLARCACAGDSGSARPGALDREILDQTPRPDGVRKPRVAPVSPVSAELPRNSEEVARR
jgi:hypothetical protein